MADDSVSFTDFEMEEARAIELATQPVYKLDNLLHVQFYKHAELNAFKSKQEGRKIFDEKVYIRILAPANRLNTIEQEATDTYKLRFAKQYAQFLQGAEQLVSGTPIGEMTGISAAQVLEFKALKISTVEQLAGMADGTAQLLGVGGMEVKKRAQRFLDQRADSTLKGEENRALQAQLAEAMKRIAALEGQSEKVEVKVTSGVAAPKA